MPPGTALATADAEAKGPAQSPLARLLISKQSEIEKAIGDSMSAERMIQIARANALRNNDLANCLPISVYDCLMRAAALRLDIEPSAMEAYLIPRYDSKNRVHVCSFQLGYQGVRKLVYRSGLVAAFETRLVYANETFRLRYTPELDFLHEPIRDRAERGPLVGGYGYGRVKGGDPFLTPYFTVADFDRHKARGKGAQPAWASDYEAMCHKTLVIQLGKLFPRNAELIDALKHEYETYDDDPEYGKPPRRLGTAGLKQRLQLPEPEPEFTVEDGVDRPLRTEDDGPEVVDEREPGSDG